MLKIRLQRIGRKNDPSFRVVCVDSKKGPKSGNNVEILGSYDPKQNSIAIKGERVEHWISQGAQISDTVNNILIKDGIIKAKKKHVSRGKKNTRTPEAEEAKAEVKVETPAENTEAPTQEVSSDTASPTNEKSEATLEAGTESSEGFNVEEVVEEKKEEVV